MLDSELSTAIMTSVDTGFDAQVALTAELVKFPSVRGAEHTAQDFIAAQLRERGLAVDRWQIDVEAIRHMPGFSPVHVGYDNAFAFSNAFKRHTGVSPTHFRRELAQMPAYRELIGEMLRVRIDGGDLTVRGRTLGQAALRFVLVGVERGEITTAHRPEVLADILLGAITTAIGNWSADRSYGLEGELDQAAAALLDLFAPDRRPQSRAS